MASVQTNLSLFPVKGQWGQVTRGKHKGTKVLVGEPDRHYPGFLWVEVPIFKKRRKGGDEILVLTDETKPLMVNAEQLTGPVASPAEDIKPKEQAA